MSTGENHKPETLYEGWTDDEILFHQCVRFLHSLQEIFSTAHEAMKNQAWFINGTVEEIVADLKQKRAAIQKYLDGIRDPQIAAVVETCAKKIDEYIASLEKKLEHPLVQQQKREVRKRIKKTFSGHRSTTCFRKFSTNKSPREQRGLFKKY
ncbi:MAG: hypothetical protein U0519_03340 [Candidatus Gracilibacteria bacterium]